MKTLITIFIATFILFNPIKEDPKEKRIKFLNKVFEQLETRIANPAWLETKSYKAFKKKLYKEKNLLLNENDFLSLLNKEREKLPFTHFYLKRKKTRTTSTINKKEGPAITWRAIDKQTAYLNARTFSGNGLAMIKALQGIGYSNYNNLIIDLRGNTGGSLDAPVILGQFLTNKAIDAGYYMTRKWFLENKRDATLKDVPSFPFLKEFTSEAIQKMYANEAAFRMVIPEHDRPIYKGNVYVLVSKHTASACEPLIDLFKKEKIATLVGVQSAGAMLSGFEYTINEEFNIFLPIADYQTANGERLDKIGVAPDVKVESEKALDYVLDILINKE
ncbi:hypothetical protein D7030_04220 [Flavobacteriaceae bacterium AU392]|nr:hypothetical protein D1817_10695 [Flavobacteriaceae bacterium]RKM85883.1 hypothetical protein D7030_04220 [Flavobacteriaceae bacterium AU392]